MYLANDKKGTREMGRRAREAFLARHNWETEVRPFLSGIRKLAKAKEESIDVG
jgi:hypothetical protein